MQNAIFSARSRFTDITKYVPYFKWKHSYNSNNYSYKDVFFCFSGDFEINIDCLETHKDYQVRPLHAKYVEEIKNKFQDFNLQTYQPLVVMVATVEKEAFKEANVSVRSACRQLVLQVERPSHFGLWGLFY